MSTNFDKLTDDILKNIGGKENISNVTHCMTRLRFNLKDESKIANEGIRNTQGVLGVAHSGGQFQVIIGQTVDKVYAELTDKIGFNTGEIEEMLEKPK